MTNILLENFAKRHSFYEINNKIHLSDNDIYDLVKRALELYPSAFNAQEARVSILLKEKHIKLWNITKDTLLSVTPKEKQSSMLKKIESFANGYGTILYFIDTDIVKQQEESFPLYAEKFKIWAEQSNGILQFMIWSILAENNIGANLQHYNPLIDEQIKKEYNIPNSYQLIAQMPFGGIISTPPPHKVKNVETKIIY